MRISSAAAIRFVAAALVVTLAVAGCGGNTSDRKTPFPSPTSIADVARVLVLALGETRYVSAEEFIAQSARTTVTQESMKASWEALAKQDGKFKSVGEPTAGATSADGTDVAVPVTFAGGSEVIHVTVDPTMHVTAITIPPGSGHNPLAS